MPDLQGESTTSDQAQIISPTQAVSEPTTVSSPTVSPISEESKISKAVIKTNKGDITLTLFYDKAPNTVKNFAAKAKTGFYNNLTFHRVEDWVIQGGDPLGNGTGKR
ncbi:MAG: peptidylprolyl isomerase, partial [Patescibacteria group bacterium]|nr:peptidylprolyl isomerase [Patescibacteria group bacterium]